MTTDQFERLCALLPHRASWGDSLTPAIVQGICDAVAAQPQAEPVMWQQRWTNPGVNPNVSPEEVDWKPLDLKGRTEAKTLRDLVTYTFDGKPCYEVRALYTHPAAPMPAQCAQAAEVDMLPGECWISLDAQALRARDRGDAEPVPAVPQWMPIETAPRDGKEVLLLVKLRAGIRGKCLVGHHMEGGHCIEDHPPIAAGWYFWNGCMFDKAAEPTHWMPLPPAPGAAAPPPVALTPLTDERIDEIWDRIFDHDDPDRKLSFRKLITQAIEAAHGIGVTP